MSGNLNEFGITHLRHVDLAVPDFETQRTFYKDTWGLTEVGHRRGPVVLRRGGLARAVRRSGCARPTRSGST